MCSNQFTFVRVIPIKEFSSVQFLYVVGLLEEVSFQSMLKLSFEMEDECKWPGRLFQMTTTATPFAKFRCCAQHFQISTFHRTESSSAGDSPSACRRATSMQDWHLGYS